MKYLFTLIIAVLFMHCTTHAQGWEQVGTGTNVFKGHGGITALLYDNGLVYAAGYGTLAKWNGASWEKFGTSPNDWSTMCIDKVHNFYTPAIRDTGRWGVMKWDGAVWSELGKGGNELNLIREISAVCTDKDGNVYAAGAFKDSAGNYNIAKWDGTSWTKLGAGNTALNGNSVIRNLAADNRGNIYAAGFFTRSGYPYVAKWDGTTWSQVGNGDNPFSIDPAKYLQSYISTLYMDDADNIYGAVCISNSYSFITKWNGSSWTDIGSRYVEVQGSTFKYNKAVFSQSIDAINAGKDGIIYIGGAGVYDSATGRACVMKWNGTRWVRIATGHSALNANGAVMAICMDTSDILYAAGYFTDNYHGEKGKNYVARHNMRDTITQTTSGMHKISAWPNPANKLLTIKGIEFNEYIYIYDMSGLIKQTILNLIAPSGATPVIDISGLAAGTYFLRSKNCVPFMFTKY